MSWAFAVLAYLALIGVGEEGGFSCLRGVFFWIEIALNALQSVRTCLLHFGGHS